MSTLTKTLVWSLLLAVAHAITGVPTLGAPQYKTSATRRSFYDTQHHLTMMGNNAPEGPFTPIVLAGKVVLGEKTFNKVRGKAIQIHSTIITEFCETYGVPRSMRGALVKKAKTTGGRLGFLN